MNAVAALAYANPSNVVATQFFHQSSRLSTRKGHPSSALPNQQKLSVLVCSSSTESGGGGGGVDGEKKAERRSFLSLEEAGLVEISGLDTHERFLCRLTISSLNLLRVISEQEGCSIEELNAGRICDWFLKDKLKREQNMGSAVLQWEDDPDFGF